MVQLTGKKLDPLRQQAEKEAAAAVDQVNQPYSTENYRFCSLLATCKEWSERETVKRLVDQTKDQPKKSEGRRGGLKARSAEHL